MKLEDVIVLYKSETYKYYQPTTMSGQIIDTWYIFDSHNDYLDKYLNYYRNLPNLTSVIVDAVDGRFELTNNGIQYFIKHNHQKYYTDKKGKTKGIPPDVLKQVRENVIKEINSIEVVDSFEDLFNIIADAKVKGFGDLSIYDTSIRVAQFLNLTPLNVYLHAGSRTGMKHLENKGYVPYGTSDLTFIGIESLPSELKALEPLEIEHFLCAKKKELELLEENSRKLLL